MNDARWQKQQNLIYARQQYQAFMDALSNGEIVDCLSVESKEALQDRGTYWLAEIGRIERWLEENPL